jgi:hypothetical protein
LTKQQGDSAVAGFRREVALLALPVLTFAAVALGHWQHFTPATSAWVTAAFIAGGTAITAALAVPRSMTAIGGAVITLFTIVAHYWWKLPPSETGALLILIQTLFGMHVRAQATPVFGVRTAPEHAA